MKKWAFKLFTSKEKLATPAKERGMNPKPKGVVKRHNTLWLKRHQRYNNSF
jgi:hypothetical protein